MSTCQVDVMLRPAPRFSAQAMAKGQVTAIESIVLRCGVSRWEWTQGYSDLIS